MGLIQVPENARRFGFETVEALAGSHIAAAEVTFSQDGMLRTIYYEKPADVDLTIELHSNTDPDALGAVIALGVVLGSDGKTSGAISAGRPVLGTDGATGSKLVITTANGTSGTKRITPIVSPADVGV